MKILYLEGSYSIENINDVYKIIQEKEFDCIDYTKADVDQYIGMVIDFYNNNVTLQPRKMGFDFSFFAFYQYVKDFFSFSSLIFSSCEKSFQNKYFYNNVISDIYNMFFESIVVVFIISFFFGINAGYQSYVQLCEYGAADNGLGILFVIAFKQSGVLLAIFALSAKYIAGIISKIGFMKISDEWFALEVMKIHPKVFLFKTKIYSLLFLIPFFSYCSIIFSTLGSFLVFKVYHGVNFSFLMSTCVIGSIKILFIPLIKGVIIGLYLALISCYEAFLIEKSSNSIIFSMNRGLVIGIIGSFILNVLLDFII